MNSSKKKITPDINYDINKIQTFDPKTLPRHPFVYIVSKRRSGKTHATSHLLYELRNGWPEQKEGWQKVYLFSETAHYPVDHPYSFIPIQNRFERFDEAILKGILDNQRNIKLTNKNLDPEYRIENNILIILDDVIGDEAVTSSVILKRLATQGRHISTSVFALSQELSSRGGFSSTIRKNVDVYMTFPIFDQGTREMASKAYCSIVDRKEGEELMNRITSLEDYMSCVMMISKSNIRTYEDYIYKYKAPEQQVKKFVLGRPDNELYNKISSKLNQNRQYTIYPQTGPRFTNKKFNGKKIRIGDISNIMESPFKTKH